MPNKINLTDKERLLLLAFEYLCLQQDSVKRYHEKICLYVPPDLEILTGLDLSEIRETLTSLENKGIIEEASIAGFDITWIMQ